MIAARAFTAVVVMAIGLLTTSVASADETDPPCVGLSECLVDGGGIHSGLLTEKQTIALGQSYPDGSAEAEDPSSWYEFVAVVTCPGNTPDVRHDVSCEFAETFCEEHVPNSEGPRSQIHRRVVTEEGPQGNWEPLAYTCFTPVVPARSGDTGEELTQAMILEQFHRTAFAEPGTTVQPSDNATLVTLPVYFQVTWPDAGFQPGEIDTTDLLGHEVRIRPTLVDYTYHFGDDTSYGPTASEGGPHPDGDVTHAYEAAGDYAPWVAITYGGEVSVDGSEWSTIPATVTIDGSAEPLEVHTSRNHLVND